jgi:hypothetical protein
MGGRRDLGPICVASALLMLVTVYQSQLMTQTLKIQASTCE